MKKLIFPFVIIVLLSLFASCTADELPTKEVPPMEVAQEGEYVPPIITKP